MDEKDKEIIQMLQAKFPLVTEPYQAIGDKLWMDEVSVISRIARMIESGVIRHVGPFFDSKKLGYKGCLAAVKVPEKDIDKVAQIINSYDEVTHNYLREGDLNMWFTVIASSEGRRDEIILQIKQKSGLKICVFPSKRLYKVKVDLD